jgi:hypothetical protein
MDRSGTLETAPALERAGERHGNADTDIGHLQTCGKGDALRRDIERELAIDPTANERSEADSSEG